MPKQGLAHYSSSTINALPPPPPPPEFWGGLNFNHSPRDSKDSFLCWLYGDLYKTSPSLEDQDNQTPPHQSLGSIQSLCGRSLFANSPYSAVPSYTHRYAQVRTYTHVHTHTVPLCNVAGQGSQRAHQILYGPEMETPPGEDLAQILKHLGSNSCTYACKASALQVGKLRPRE